MRLHYLLLATILTLFAATADAAVAPTARLLLSNPAPFVGEETLLTLELRTPPRPGAATPVWPELSPFVVADLPLSPSRREQSVEGEILLQTVQKTLRPLQPGTFTLAGAGIRLGDRLLPTAPLTLRVRPLPRAGRPDTFFGAVGKIEMLLDAGGRGNREIVLTLSGTAPLGDLPPPLAFPGKNERLVPVADTSSGTAPGLRRRELRYLYLPGSDTAGTLRFEYPCFDPGDVRYRILRASVAPQHSALYLVLVLLPVAAVLAVLALRRRALRPATLERTLTRLLGTAPATLPRQTIVARLAARGVPAELLAELQAYWEAADRRFAPAATNPSTADRAREKGLARRLGKAIDKRPSFP